MNVRKKGIDLHKREPAMFASSLKKLDKVFFVLPLMDTFETKEDT